MKMLDFGAARGVFEVAQQPDTWKTPYVQTRYYRSPEMLLQPFYNFKCDIWSLGCVLGECIIRTPLFRGRNSHDQYYCITSVLGKPPPVCCDPETRRKKEGKTKRKK